MLMTETNTRTMERRVLRAAHNRLHKRGLIAFFEHDQWWVEHRASGAQWSAVDCQTTTGVDYIDFEQVTEGEP